MIIRVKKDKNNPYVLLNKTFLNQKNLSFKAKGLLSFLLSLPDDWNVNIEHLSKISTDGKDSVRTAIKELIETKYITRNKIKNEKGQFENWEYIITEKPTLENPTSEDPTLLINDLNNIYSPFQGNEQNTNQKEPNHHPDCNLNERSNEEIASKPILNNAERSSDENRDKPKEKKETPLEKQKRTVLTIWNSTEGLRQHKDSCLGLYFKKKHEKLIDYYGTVYIRNAIKNYAKIVNDDKYYFNYKWSLWDFIARGIEKFSDDADPFVSFLTSKPKQSITPEVHYDTIG